MNKKEYDEALSNHRMKVEECIYCISTALLIRGMCHDRSEREEAEYSAFLKAADRKDCEYDSEQCRRRLIPSGDALSHHYAVNEQSGEILIDTAERLRPEEFGKKEK